MREAGFSLSILRPRPTAPGTHPPGQGRLLLVLRGAATVREHADPASKVLETDRPDRGAELSAGRQLFAVANDARWSLTGSSGAVVLCVGTSVPRARRRTLDLGVRRSPLSSRLVFGNDALRVELLAPRGARPGLHRWRRAPGDEHLLALHGGLRVQVRGGGQHAVEPGSLVTIPAGSRWRAVPIRWRGARALLLSPALELRSAERLDREAVKGFTPFRR